MNNIKKIHEIEEKYLKLIKNINEATSLIMYPVCQDKNIISSMYDLERLSLYFLSDWRYIILILHMSELKDSDVDLERLLNLNIYLNEIDEVLNVTILTIKNMYSFNYNSLSNYNVGYHEYLTNLFVFFISFLEKITLYFYMTIKSFMNRNDIIEKIKELKNAITILNKEFITISFDSTQTNDCLEKYRNQFSLFISLIST